MKKRTLHGMQYHAHTQVQSDSSINVTIYRKGGKHPVHFDNYFLSEEKAIHKAFKETKLKLDNLIAKRLKI